MKDMRTENINIYQFDELSDEAKNKARDWWRSVDDRDISHVLDDFKDEMEDLGVEVSKFTYSVSWSQGNGAGFDYEVNLPKWLDATAKEKEHATIRRLLKSDKIDVLVRGTQGYDFWYSSHHNGVEVYRDTYISARISRALNKFDEYLIKWMKNKAYDLHQCLGDELEHLHSDEYIDECIRANEYEFTESGVLW